MKEDKINNCKCGGVAELDYSDVREIYGDEWQTIEVSCAKCFASIDYDDFSQGLPSYKNILISAWNQINPTN